MNQIGSLSATAFLLTLPCVVSALEYPVGNPQNLAGMEIAAVYLQPIDMEPAGHMRPAAQTDVHLEADIHALATNPNGYAEGAWIPFLHVAYTLTKDGGTAPITGTFMAMVASDGPHYGDNVKLDGPGRYHLQYTIYAPDAAENPLSHHFGRHTDRETGVRPWFKPLSVEWDFTYAGVGKKGGY